MPLILDQGTKPDGLAIKVWDLKSRGNIVFLGDYEITMKDFVDAAEYVLTITDLEPDDPRLQFVKYVQSIREVEGYNAGRKRLESPITLVSSEEPK
jgi:hypothetical protein